MYSYGIYMREFHMLRLFYWRVHSRDTPETREVLDFGEKTEQRSICRKNHLDRAREICKKIQFDDQERLDS